MSSRVVARKGFASLVLLLCGLAHGANADEIERGDSAWRLRAEGERAGRPRPGPVREAVTAYEGALFAQPDELEARWKLLRALHFFGDFALEDPNAQAEVFERARDVAEQGLQRLDQRLDVPRPLYELELPALEQALTAAGVSKPDVAQLYFWSAIHWGAWSRGAGVMNLVREGVANRLHRYAKLTQSLDPTCEEGGALRLLGRLHARLPRVPLITGWVDRDRSIPLLERALDLAPDHPGNRLLLGLSLLDLAPARRGEALELLGEVDSLVPRPSMRIEDLAIREQARRRLADVTASP